MLSQVLIALVFTTVIDGLFGFVVGQAS